MMMPLPHVAPVCTVALLAAAQVGAQQFLSDRLLDFDSTDSILAIGDINADGIQDLVVTSNSPRGVSVRLGLGEGRLAPRVLIYTAQNRAVTAASIGDIDGDGDGDIVVGTFQALDAVLTNNGTAGFTATSLGAAANTITDVEKLLLVDIDQDGDLDLYEATRFQNLVYINNGAGTFTDETATRVPIRSSGFPETVFDLKAGDLDGDGAPEIVVTTNFEIERLDNDGSGVYSRGALIGTGANARGIALADINGDGDLDLYVAQAGNDVVFVNNGLGTLSPGSNLGPREAEEGLAVVAGDFNGDGSVDFAVGERNGGRLLRNIGPSSGFVVEPFAPAFDQLGTGNQGLVAIDWEGDGDLDVVRTGLNPRLHLGDGTGALPDRTQGAMRPNEDVLLALDVDGDLDQDLVVATGVGTQRGPLLLRENNGLGVFQDRPASLPPLLSVTDIEAADFNGDGATDLVAIAGGQVRLLFNGGNGIFTDVTVGRIAAAGAALAVGDWQGDGDADLYVATDGLVSLGSGSDALWTNDGTGVFTAVALPMTQRSYSVAAGDVDGDGDLDFVVARTPFLGAGVTGVLENQGGVLQAVPFPMAVPTFALPALLDLEGDGDLDVVLSQSFSGPLTVLENRAMTFVDTTAQAVPGGAPQGEAVVVADVDLDGDDDLAVGSALLLNSAGVFNDASSRYSRDAVMELAVDVDNDGDPDLISSQDLFLNRHRHVSVPVPPKIRQGFAVRMLNQPGYGAASAIGLLGLAGSRAPRPVQVPGLGLLMVDSISLALVGITSIASPVGTADITLTVPNGPALVGTEVYFQGAIVTGTVRLTNALAVRIE